jgi:hypothetical protein
MDKLQTFLKEWAVNYLKSRDLIHKNILDIIDGDVGFIVELKGCKQGVVVEVELDDLVDVFKKLEPFKGQKSILFVYNTKDNFDTVLDSWKELAAFDRQFMVVFVNPFSISEHRWSFFPMTHNSLSDRNKVEKGLKILGANVDRITLKEIEDNI